LNYCPGLSINNKSVIFQEEQPIIGYNIDEKTYEITKNNINFYTNFNPISVTINNSTYVYIISEIENASQSLNVYIITTEGIANMLFNRIIYDSYIAVRTIKFMNYTIDLNNFIFVLHCTLNEGSSYLNIFKIDTDNKIGNIGVPLKTILPDYSYDMQITRYDNDYYAYVVSSSSNEIGKTAYTVNSIKWKFDISYNE